MIKVKKLFLSNCDPGGALGKGRSAEGGKEREITAGEKEKNNGKSLKEEV